jgi:hypothetical protein
MACGPIQPASDDPRNPRRVADTNDGLSALASSSRDFPETLTTIMDRAMVGGEPVERRDRLALSAHSLPTRKRITTTMTITPTIPMPPLLYISISHSETSRPIQPIVPGRLEYPLAVRSSQPAPIKAHVQT